MLSRIAAGAGAGSSWRAPSPGSAVIAISGSMPANASHSSALPHGSPEGHRRLLRRAAPRSGLCGSMTNLVPPARSFAASACRSGQVEVPPMWRTGAPAASSAQPASAISVAATITLPRATSLTARSIDQRVGVTPREHRRDRIGAEDRMRAAGRRHRRRRVGEAQADHAGRGHRPQVIDDDTAVVAVDDAGKARRRVRWRAPIASATASAHAAKARPHRRRSAPRRRVPQTRAAAHPSTRPFRRCVAYCGTRATARASAGPVTSARPRRARSVAAAIGPRLAARCQRAHCTATVMQRLERSVVSPTTRSSLPGRRSRSTLPPLRTMPTRRPRRSSVRSIRHASGTADDGSTTIRSFSQVRRIASTMPSSVAVAIAVDARARSPQRSARRAT